MPPRYLMRDVIVCIPGITGSVLRKDGKDVWNISGGAVFNALLSLGKSIKQMKLEDDPIDVDDIDGIKATSVIRDVQLIPGLWKIDGYTKMMKHIEATFDVTRGKNLFEFPYDWRRDNRVAARQLSEKSGRLAEGLAAVVGRRGREADHRRPLDGRARRPLLHRVPRRVEADAATGHLRDAVRRLDVLARHARQRQEDQVLRPDRPREVADRSLPAAPIFKCYDGGDGTLVRVTEAQIKHLDAAKTEGAIGFHEEIRLAVESNLAIPAYADDRYDLRPIVGIEQPTAQSASRDGDRVQLIRRRGDEDAGATAPSRALGTPREFERLENAIYSPEKHASLQTDDDVLFQLTGHPDHGEFDPANWRRRAEDRAVAGRRGHGRAGGSIQVRVKPQGDPGSALVAIARMRDRRGDRAAAARGGRRRLVHRRARPVPGGRLPGSAVGTGSNR